MDTSEGSEFRGLGLPTTSSMPQHASSWWGGTEQEETAVAISVASQSCLSSLGSVQDGSDISAQNMLRAVAIVRRIAQENQPLQNTTGASHAPDESTFHGLGLTTTTSSMPQHASWCVATTEQREDDVASPAFQSSTPTSSGVGLQESEISAKKLRAMAIVRRFAQVSQQQLQNNSTVGGIHRDGNGNGSNTHDNAHLQLQNNDKYYNHSTPNPAPDEYRKRRLVFAEQFEHRKQEALLRNLEYVARQQIERSKERLAQLDATRMYEQQVTSHHEAMMKSRSQSNHHHAGIGTQKRQREEQKRIRSLPKALSSNDNSVAIYVAGISTRTNSSNGTTTKSNTTTEEMMHSLFGCYGKLRKIHFYVDKHTGKRKGDALVIYDVDTKDDHPMEARNSLIDSVCSQVRGTDHHSGGSVLDVWRLVYPVLNCVWRTLCVCV
jgi:hypothetical protein